MTGQNFTKDDKEQVLNVIYKVVVFPSRLVIKDDLFWNLISYDVIEFSSAISERNLKELDCKQELTVLVPCFRFVRLKLANGTHVWGAVLLFIPYFLYQKFII